MTLIYNDKKFKFIYNNEAYDQSEYVVARKLEVKSLEIKVFSYLTLDTKQKLISNMAYLCRT